MVASARQREGKRRWEEEIRPRGRIRKLAEKKKYYEGRERERISLFLPFSLYRMAMTNGARGQDRMRQKCMSNGRSVRRPSKVYIYVRII